MRNFVVTILSLLLVYSCVQKNKEYIIPHDDMISIVTELHIANAMYTLPDIVEEDLSVYDSVQYYNEILKKHGYSREQLDSTFLYYTENLKEFKDLYNNVETRLNDIKKELDPKEQE